MLAEVFPEPVRDAPAATDVSALWRPGVYALLSRGRCVFVGKGKKLMPRLYAHSIHRRGEHLPGLPRAPIVYDQVLVYPATVDSLDTEFTRVCAHHMWSPPCAKS